MKNIKITFCFLLVACLSVTSTNCARAGVIVNFPSASSTTTASAGEFFFLPSHTVSETFSGTGLASISELNLKLDVDFNNLNSGGFVDFNVLVNNNLVGNFTISESDPLGVLDQDYSFSSIAGAGTYTLELAATNVVPGGFGSVGFSETSSTAELGQVPEPTSIAIFGMIGLLVCGRRRKS